MSAVKIAVNPNLVFVEVKCESDLLVATSNRVSEETSIAKVNHCAGYTLNCDKKMELSKYIV